MAQKGVFSHLDILTKRRDSRPRVGYILAEVGLRTRKFHFFGELLPYRYVCPEPVLANVFGF